MKRTLNTYEIADALYHDENANWSRNGAKALAEHLEQYEEDTGTELELDVVAIRCDMAEYESLREWAEDYFGANMPYMQAIGINADADDEQADEAIREYIRDNGTLIEFDGGVIVSSF